MTRFILNQVRTNTLVKSIYSKLPRSAKIKLRQLYFGLLRRSISKNKNVYYLERKNVSRDSDSLSCLSENPLVSIVLPNYNHLASLEESIESCLSQDYANIELIIVDDGSQDESRDFLRNYLHNPKVKLIFEENSKLPNALNAGFRFAKGDLLTWTSADNRMLSQAVSTMVDFFKRHPDIGFAYGNYRIIDALGDPLRDSDFRIQNQSKEDSSIIFLPNADDFRRSVPDNFIGPYFMYRKEVLESIGNYSRLPGIEDYEYWLRIERNFKLANIGNLTPFYEYRVHENTMSNQWRELKIQEMLKSLAESVKSESFGYSQDTEKVISEGTGVAMPMPSKPFVQTSIERIVIYLDRWGFGGVEKMVEDLCNELIAQSKSVILILPQGANARTVPSEFVHNFISEDHLIEIIRAFSPQIINAHYALAHIEGISKLKIPIIQTLHNTYVWLDKSELSLWGYSDEFTDHYVAVSTSVQEWFHKTFDIPIQKISVISNGVSVQEHENVSNDPNSNGLHFILCPASIALHKRQLTLVQAFLKISEKFPSLNLVFAGPCLDVEYYKILERFIFSNKLTKRVSYLGNVDNLSALMKDCTIVVLPSMYEGASLSLTEAAVLRKKIVCTKVGNWSELGKLTVVTAINNVPESLVGFEPDNLYDFSISPGETFVDRLANAIETSFILDVPKIPPRRADFFQAKLQISTMASNYLMLFQESTKRD